MAAFADALSWAARLSHTTTSPARSSGTKACSAYVSKTRRSVAPGNAIGAITPDLRIPEIKVTFFHAPGTVAWTRSPAGARPYVRLMAVVAPVSSMKTT